MDPMENPSSPEPNNTEPQSPVNENETPAPADLDQGASIVTLHGTHTTSTDTDLACSSDSDTDFSAFDEEENSDQSVKFFVDTLLDNVVQLERHMAEVEGSGEAKDITVMNFQQWLLEENQRKENEARTAAAAQKGMKKARKVKIAESPGETNEIDSSTDEAANEVSPSDTANDTDGSSSSTAVRSDQPRDIEDRLRDIMEMFDNFTRNLQSLETAPVIPQPLRATHKRPGSPLLEIFQVGRRRRLHSTEVSPRIHKPNSAEAVSPTTACCPLKQELLDQTQWIQDQLSQFEDRPIEISMVGMNEFQLHENCRLTSPLYALPVVGRSDSVPRCITDSLTSLTNERMIMRLDITPTKIMEICPPAAVESRVDNPEQMNDPLSVMNHGSSTSTNTNTSTSTATMIKKTTSNEDEYMVVNILSTPEVLAPSRLPVRAEYVPPCERTNHTIQFEAASSPTPSVMVRPPLPTRLWNVLVEFFRAIFVCLQVNKDCFFCLGFVVAFVVSASFLTAFFYRTLSVNPQLFYQQQLTENVFPSASRPDTGNYYYL